MKGLSAAGLPAAHVGVAAGPVVRGGGDYFGRTVNLATDRRPAGAGRVLASEPVVERVPPQGVAFVELGWCGWRASPSPYGCWRPAGRSAGRFRFASARLADAAAGQSRPRPATTHQLLIRTTWCRVP